MGKDVVTVVFLFLKIYLCDSENVIVGSTEQLACQIQNGSRWEKYSDEAHFWETIINGGRYSGAYSSSLTITNFQIEDSGYYRCKVHGTGVTGDNIQLYPEIQAFIGESVTLTCTKSGTTIYWYRIGNRGAQTLSDSGEYEGTRTNYLKIKSLAANTAVVHYCQLVNGTKGPDITVSISSWSSWTEWGECDAVCVTGQRVRTRTCLEQCTGSAIQREQCTVGSKVEGGWSLWYTSGPCTGTCGSGSQKRIRYCDNPPPENCGAQCQGDNSDNISCLLSACTVDGEWSSWSHWEHCNVTSGTGQQRRRRFCDNPTPSNGGDSCRGEENDYNSCEEKEQQQSRNIQIAVGTVCAVLIIVVVMTVVVMYAKRRWYNSKKRPDYEITDMTRVKAHIYGETQVNLAYQNEQQGAGMEVTAAENQCIDVAHLVDTYDVSDLTKRYKDTEYFLQSLRAEFKLLNDSTDDTIPLDSQYEIVNTGLIQDVNQLNLNSSSLNVLNNDSISILLEVPQKNLTEQFWTLVDDHCIETIVLLVNENEKVTEFYPTIDDVFRMNKFEIYLDSVERKNKNIKLLTFNLENKTTQSTRQIKILKTIVWESYHLNEICFILDKASEMRGATVMIINSKMNDLSVCGVLTVCLNVIYSIKNGSHFSILRNAMAANKNDSGFFKNLDDYELCYKVIKHYLEDVHEFVE